MLEFIKPFIALTVMALIAGFIVTLEGVSRTGSSYASVRAERAAAEMLARTVHAHVIRKDTLLTADDEPVQWFTLDKTEYRIVKVRSNTDQQTPPLLILADSSDKPISALSLSGSRSFSELFLAAFPGNFQNSSALCSSTDPITAPSLPSNTIARASQYSRLANPEGAHADQ